MLFNYTTHFLVLYYFSSSSPTKVRGVREELKLFPVSYTHLTLPTILRV